MQNQSFFFKTKGFLLTALFLSLAFSMQAQEANHVPTGAVSPAKPAAAVIYVSQFNQMSPSKQEYMKAHPEEFTIAPDPVQVAAPAKTTETFTTPDGQIMLGKAPAGMANHVKPTQHAPAQPSQMSPSGHNYTPPAELVHKKATVTHAEFDKMTEEKRQFILSHAAEFDIID